MKIKSIRRLGGEFAPRIIFNNGSVLKAVYTPDDKQTKKQFKTLENRLMYADFDAIKAYKNLGESKDLNIFDVAFEDNIMFRLELIKNKGFNFKYGGGNWRPIYNSYKCDFEGSIFVPCYNLGDVSGKLTLIYTREERAGYKFESEYRVDISKCVAKVAK